MFRLDNIYELINLVITCIELILLKYIYIYYIEIIINNTNNMHEFEMVYSHNEFDKFFTTLLEQKGLNSSIYILFRGEETNDHSTPHIFCFHVFFIL